MIIAGMAGVASGIIMIWWQPVYPEALRGNLGPRVGSSIGSLDSIFMVRGHIVVPGYHYFSASGDWRLVALDIDWSDHCLSCELVPVSRGAVIEDIPSPVYLDNAAVCVVSEE